MVESIALRSRSYVTPFSKSSCHQLVVLSLSVMVLLAALPTSNAKPYVPSVCRDPQRMLDGATQRICKFVIAFRNIGEFTGAMEDMLDAKVMRNTVTLEDPEVKRQDLDHVFLRFGRSGDI